MRIIYFMALIYPLIALPTIILFVLGLIILFKRKLSISSRRELSGYPALFLSLSYILISAVAFIKIFYYTGDLMIDYPIFGSLVVVVTITSMFFTKQTSKIGI